MPEPLTGCGTLMLTARKRQREPHIFQLSIPFLAVPLLRNAEKELAANEQENHEGRKD